MAIPYAEYDPFFLLLQIIAQSLVTLEFAVLSIILLYRYIQRKKIEVIYLALAILLMGIGIGLSTIPMILCKWAPEVDIIYGLPLGSIYHLWWTNLANVFNTISCYFLLRFCQTLFKDKISKRAIVIYIVLLLGFNIPSVYIGIFLYEPGKPSLPIYMSAFFLLLTLYAWITLFHLALHDAKNLNKNIFRLGLHLISYSALLTAMGFMLWAISMILGLTQQMGPFVWFLNCFTGFLLYLGYALPPWFRKLFNYPESE